MKISNSSANFINKTELQQKVKTKINAELKQTNAGASELLANYAKANIKSCSFGSKDYVKVPIQKRMELAKFLGINDKETKDKLFGISDLLFRLALPFLYMGMNYEDIEKIDGFLEFGKDENQIKNYYDISRNSKEFLLNEPQKAKELAQYILKNNDLAIDETELGIILLCVNDKTVGLLKKIITDKDSLIDENDIHEILVNTTDSKVEFAEKLFDFSNEEYPKDIKIDIIKNLNDSNLELAEELTGINKDIIAEDKKLYINSQLKFDSAQISQILKGTNKDTIDYVKQLLNDPDISYTNKELALIISNLNDSSSIKLADKLINDKSDNKFKPEEISRILKGTNENTIEFVEEFLFNNEKYTNDEKSIILNCIDDINLEAANKLIELPDKYSIYPEGIEELLKATQTLEEQREDIEDKKIKTQVVLKVLDKINIYYNPFFKSQLEELIQKSNKKTIPIIEMMLNLPDKYDIKDIISVVESTENSSWFGLTVGDKNKVEMAQTLLSLPYDMDLNILNQIIQGTQKENVEFLKKLIVNKDKIFLPEEITDIAVALISNRNISTEKYEELEKCISYIQEGEMPTKYFQALVKKINKINYKDIKKMERILGLDVMLELSAYDISKGAELVELCNKQNINEISLKRKKTLLRKLVENNSGLFHVSDKLKQYFPLIPANQEEYCSLLPSIVRSIGIETNTLSDDEIKDCKKSINNLAEELKSISDEEFNSLTISQEYKKSDFIKDVYESVKDLTPQERQKVYDYYGFELVHNENGTQPDSKRKSKFSISGYPVNLNNGKKLAQINNLQTKAVVEQLRPKVIAFSMNNPIKTENKLLEKYLNQTLKYFPELRTQIEKGQHGTHTFDLIKHSLKVMQKIVQDPNFEELSESDKQIMLLASLFHDQNKTEGKRDGAHPQESAFDTYYIVNKLKMSKDDKIKLYTLIRYHEWLNYLNSNKSDVIKRQQSVAFDLQYDNLFELSKIFTQADMKAVKNDDYFYERFKDAFKEHSEAIEKNIAELKTSQPLMPVTPIPKASEIEKAITRVNADGSTNIKGVYKNRGGLVIIKYNEVENGDWEKIGFPKGSISSGIEAHGFSSRRGKIQSSEDVNTGNIKFFAHGLDYSNQLAKFEAFALPDSEALLSVSYTERPESKYRFFRTQGVLLTTPTKYMHGGGETDAGSGRGKNIDEFKRNYIFGGFRESDRKYISELIKDTLGMTDEEYIKFVKDNADKPFTSIEPEEVRNKIIQAFSAINSNTRKGDRAYNEMYITNPEVMGVFAYSENDKVGDVIKFVNKQKDFLKKYAIKKDMPFIVFGD